MFLKGLESRVSTSIARESAAIPYTLYQTWFSKEISRFLYSEIAAFWELNSDLDIEIYDDKDCSEFMTRYWSDHPILDIYDRAIFGPMKADIFRYCVIATFGGYYCDISKTLTRPFRFFCDRHTTGLISFEGNQFFLPVSSALNSLVSMPQNYVSNWAFGFSRGHPFLHLLIDRIVALAPRFEGRVFENPKNAIVTYTGPGLFTLCLHEYLSSSGDQKLVQASTDFEGSGIYNSRKSRLRYLQRLSYKTARNSPILR